MPQTTPDSKNLHIVKSPNYHYTYSQLFLASLAAMVAPFSPILCFSDSFFFGKQIFGGGNSGGIKNFWSKKISGEKKYWSKEIMGEKNYWTKKIIKKI